MNFSLYLFLKRRRFISELLLPGLGLEEVVDLYWIKEPIFMQLTVEGEFLLERMQGKGGWTYVKFPKELFSGSKAFGMMKVSGSIDEFCFEGKHLMPMGNGYVFLPVAKAIRTKIRKEEGDSVTVTLFRKEVPYQAPEELIDCLKDDPGKLELFHLLPEADQRHWVEYIYSSEKMDEQSDRIIKLLHSLLP